MKGFYLICAFILVLYHRIYKFLKSRDKVYFAHFGSLVPKIRCSNDCFSITNTWKCSSIKWPYVMFMKSVLQELGQNGSSFCLTHDVWGPTQTPGTENIGLFFITRLPRPVAPPAWRLQGSQTPDLSVLGPHGLAPKRATQEEAVLLFRDLAPEVTTSHFHYIIFSWRSYKDMPRFKMSEHRCYLSIAGFLTILRRPCRMEYILVQPPLKNSVCCIMFVSYVNIWTGVSHFNFIVLHATWN